MAENNNYGPHVVCPKCGHVDKNGRDFICDIAFTDGEMVRHECDHCGRALLTRVSITYRFSTEAVVHA
jgi:predicted RNA-binding Zn-ribbon protein involved in translation (DUF1610 family)